MSVLVVIPTRDGNPHIDAFGSVSQACKTHGDAAFTITKNRHNVCSSRNMGIATFLGSKATHLLFVDDDTIIPTDTISTLLECKAAVATGCVPTMIDGKPVLAVAKAEDPPGYEWYDQWFDGIKDVPACGGACMLIDRIVLEKMEFPWFTYPEFYLGGKYSYHSDDVAFCKRISGDWLIKAHGNVRCRHTKQVEVGSLMGISSPPALIPA